MKTAPVSVLLLVAGLSLSACGVDDVKGPDDQVTDDSTLDLSRITTLRLRGGAPYGSSTGRVCIDDVLLER